MNYELAKALKDAGFPQKERGFIYLEKLNQFDKPYIKYFYSRNTKLNALPDPYKWVYAPSLSELIEACTYEFWNFYLEMSMEVLGNIWTARTKDTRGQGSTPEEAVAKLYLELNKNVNNKTEKSS
jgi:hypothetical protein